MLRQKVNSYLAIIFLGSVALASSLIMIKVSQVEEFGGSGAILDALAIDL